MSNHAHTVFRPFLSERSICEVSGSNPVRFGSSDPTLGIILSSLKGYTARQASRKGQFWEVESYDHQVREGNEFQRIIKYVLQNPVKAKLVDHWRDWKWTWLAKDLRPFYE